MPVAAKCPSCGAPLIATSVVALAPVCSHCGSVITTIGGSLGMTSAYGVGDPSITRRRVEADLAVFSEYQMKYRGMLEACKQQLEWSAERYAKLPNPPNLLPLQDVPSFWKGLRSGIGESWLFSISFPILFFLIRGILQLNKNQRIGIHVYLALAVLLLAAFAAVYMFWSSGLSEHFRIKAANDSRPEENARRQKAYEETIVAALKAAEPIKAAEDHRLRCQIRELEGLSKTVGEKEADVRRILATL